jgi:hypothetical protein
MIVPMELEEPLASVLQRLVEIDADRYEKYVPTIDSNDTEWPRRAVLVSAGADDDHFAPGHLAELGARGYLDIEHRPGKIVAPFRLTTDGRRLGHELAARAAVPADAAAISSAWPTIEPVLQAAVRAFDLAGQRAVSVDTVADAMGSSADSALRSRLQLLVAANYLEPAAAREQYVPTEKALIACSDWPASDVDRLVSGIVDGLTQRIANEPDETKRTKLQAALDELRGFILDVAKDVAKGYASSRLG